MEIIILFIMNKMNSVVIIILLVVNILLHKNQIIKPNERVILYQHRRSNGSMLYDQSNNWIK